MIKPRILIIDDDEGIRNLIASILSNDQYQIEQAENGHQALEIFHTFQPHIIILDVIIPEMSGIDILNEIRKIDNQVKIIMISGWHDLGIVKESIELGATDFITKPFTPEELRNLIQKYFSELNYFTNP